ncbi:MAG: outer membrane protein assembly factor BamD [Candidatus Puniceispirillaceae bacterium]|jgi:outer membrane protein assembly factor BamD
MKSAFNIVGLAMGWSKLWIAPLLMMALLSACSGSEEEAQIEQPVDELYNLALDTALSGDTKAAAPLFEEVERQHPYSIWAVRAQIMAAWSFYNDNDYPQAVATLNRFIELYPADPLTEYAYYLQALCYYEQIVDVERDADMTYRALDAFEELLRRYPESQYARDSKLKADLARSQLAGKEMAVGRFYLKEGHINAAIKRFATVVKEYDQTNQVPEALYRMVESYLSLGLTDEADRVAQVANYNFPDSYWTEQVNLVVENPGRAGPRGLIGSIADRALSLF